MVEQAREGRLGEADSRTLPAAAYLVQERADKCGLNRP
ncbi:hypothetical protein SAMN05216190_106143 [Pseudomonas borbori]|uniref:Uncharacterized protein n=1 Tax=Pseudomonas borbori TaxID=289003 RepID=A0A1I5NFJ7_9PSED|nr:hypothetical protein SAMN05216190_106143 [Pseudomonas borbori]